MELPKATDDELSGFLVILDTYRWVFPRQVEQDLFELLLVTRILWLNLAEKHCRRHLYALQDDPLLIPFVQDCVTASYVFASSYSADITDTDLREDLGFVSSDSVKALDALFFVQIRVSNVLSILDHARVHTEEGDQTFFLVIDDLESQCTEFLLLRRFPNDLCACDVVFAFCENLLRAG